MCRCRCSNRDRVTRSPLQKTVDKNSTPERETKREKKMVQKSERKKFERKSDLEGKRERIAAEKMRFNKLIIIIY